MVQILYVSVCIEHSLVWSTPQLYPLITCSSSFYLFFCIKTSLNRVIARLSSPAFQQLHTHAHPLILEDQMFCSEPAEFRNMMLSWMMFFPLRRNSFQRYQLEIAMVSHTSTIFETAWYKQAVSTLLPSLAAGGSKVRNARPLIQCQCLLVATSHNEF